MAFWGPESEGPYWGPDPRSVNPYPRGGWPAHGYGADLSRADPGGPGNGGTGYAEATWTDPNGVGFGGPAGGWPGIPGGIGGAWDKNTNPLGYVPPRPIGPGDPGYDWRRDAITTAGEGGYRPSSIQAFTGSAPATGAISGGYRAPASEGTVYAYGGGAPGGGYRSQSMQMPGGYRGPGVQPDESQPAGMQRTPRPNFGVSGPTNGTSDPRAAGGQQQVNPNEWPIAQLQSGDYRYGVDQNTAIQKLLIDQRREEAKGNWETAKLLEEMRTAVANRQIDANSAIANAQLIQNGQLAQAQMNLQRELSGQQLQFGREQLGAQERMFDRQAGQADRQMTINERRNELEMEVARGRLTLEQANQMLQRELGMGQLQLGREGLASNERIASGQLGLGYYNADTQRELGTGQLAYQNRALDVGADLQNRQTDAGQLANWNQTQAGLYGQDVNRELGYLGADRDLRLGQEGLYSQRYGTDAAERAAAWNARASALRDAANLAQNPSEWLAIESMLSRGTAEGAPVVSDYFGVPRPGVLGGGGGNIAGLLDSVTGSLSSLPQSRGATYRPDTQGYAIPNAPRPELLRPQLSAAYTGGTSTAPASTWTPTFTTTLQGGLGAPPPAGWTNGGTVSAIGGGFRPPAPPPADGTWSAPRDMGGNRGAADYAGGGYANAGGPVAPSQSGWVAGPPPSQSGQTILPPDAPPSLGGQGTVSAQSTFAAPRPGQHYLPGVVQSAVTGGRTGGHLMPVPQLSAQQRREAGPLGNEMFDSYLARVHGVRAADADYAQARAADAFTARPQARYRAS